jgi:hypothetical protein
MEIVQTEARYPKQARHPKQAEPAASLWQRILGFDFGLPLLNFE